MEVAFVQSKPSVKMKRSIDRKRPDSSFEAHLEKKMLKTSQKKLAEIFEDFQEKEARGNDQFVTKLNASPENRLASEQRSNKLFSSIPFVNSIENNC